jgi:hypothetical protein
MSGVGGRGRHGGIAPAVRFACLLLALPLALGACSRIGKVDTSDEGINAYPANYKTDLMAAMHAYLNDPTGIKDAAISEPLLKPVGRNTHYVACLRFTGKLSGTSYAAPKDLAAVFLAGRFDQFVEVPKELCAGVTYVPFPELEKLAR